MKKKADGNRTLCVNFCRYYKPGRNEDLECQGFVIVQRLREKGRSIPLEIPAKQLLPDAARMRELMKRVCAACAFQKEDCDFILTGGKAVPCGGFALLLHLLGSGEITIEDL